MGTASKRSRAKQLLFAVAFSLGSLFVLWRVGAYLVDTMKASEAANWPAVQAIVVSSQVLHGCGRGNSSYAEIRYAYTIAGNRYENDRVKYGMPECGSESAAQQLVDRYPVGTSVTVRVNPLSPVDSVIMVGEVGSVTWAAIIVMSPILLYWSFLSWRSIWRLRARRESAP